MSDDGMLSIRGYAKHRGCSEGAVRKAIERGKIRVVGSGKETRIDPTTADAAWAANTRTPVRTEPEGAHDGTQVRTETPDYRARYAHELEQAGRSDESKADAERRKEIALANVRELEFRTKSGAVVDRHACVSAWFAVCRTARDQLIGCRDRITSRLFLTPEQSDVVLDELRAVLAELAKEVPVIGDALPEPVEMP